MVKKNIINPQNGDTIPAPEKKNDAMGDIVFFSEIDRKEGKANGPVTSQYPVWYHEAAIEELEEEIAKTERNIQRYKREKIFDDEGIFRQMEDLKAKKRKIEKIQQSKPELRPGDKDKIHKAYENLGEEIREGLFTRSQMHLGTADAHEEAARMVTPKIDISKALTPEMAKSLDIRPDSNGKITRKDAERAWKILGKSIGEPTNVETLRRDRATLRGRG